MKSQPAVCAVLLSLAFPSLALAQRETAEAAFGTGKLSVNWQPTDLRNRSIANLPVGDVWRMSAGEAAELSTDVPILVGSLVLTPGKHRLSVKRGEDDKWTLLVFRGAAVHAEGVPTETTPITAAPLKDTVDRLTFKVDPVAKSDAAPKTNVRLHWSNVELAIPVTALTVTKINTEIGGDAAAFEFYGVPRNRETVARLQSGDLVTVGMVRIGKDDPVEIRISGVRSGMSADLVLKNETLGSAQTAVSSNERMIEMLETRLEGADEARKEAISQRIASLKDQVAKAKSRLERASKYVATAEISGEVTVGEKVAENMVSGIEAKKDTVDVTLQFGARTAKFRIDAKALVK